MVLHKEIGGFVANRLQSAIFKECVHLVLEGVVDAAEIDRVMTESIGLRWATAGPFESYHLGGGPAASGTCWNTSAPAWPAVGRPSGQPELTPEVVDLISAQVEERFRGRSYEEMTEARDRVQLAVLVARDAAEDAGQ